MTVDTRKAPDRRKLSFNRIEEILEEAERLTRCRVRSVGNWNLGQCLGHLAMGFEMSVKGTRIQTPWYIRMLGPLLKRMVLNHMSAGFKLPADAEKVLVPSASLTAAEGLEQLRQSIELFQSTSTRAAHSVFGKLNDAEWRRLHCRHAELHLSYQLPEG